MSILFNAPEAFPMAERMEERRLRSGIVMFCCATTVTTTPAALLSPVSSLTVRVTKVLPVCPATGVTVSVRLEVVMPRLILEAGMRARFDETAVTVKRLGAVTSSDTVNSSGAEVALAAMGQIEERLIVGGWF